MPLNLDFNRARFLKLLQDIIGESETVQNSPPDLIPREDNVILHLKKLLVPKAIASGGKLKVHHVTYVEGRGNLIVEYENGNEGTQTVSFIGSHLDVVPADPNTWSQDPFSLTVEGDGDNLKLFGRGTTDCLGHVAMVTELFLQLAEKKPVLKRKVVAIFIASEESSIPGMVGIDALMADGRLEELKGGPVYWVDSSDSHPTLGTASAAMWQLHCVGRLGHSGLPNQAINSLELAMDATTYIQKQFYQTFPPKLPEEEEYKFEAPSSMKPTIINTASGTSINQIPPNTTVQGDIRLTPFYNIDHCMTYVESLVTYLNNNITTLESGDRGCNSKYAISLPEGDFQGQLELTWDGEPLRGIACDRNSIGYAALHTSTKEVLGEVNPFSITGSLPLVGDMQASGFDIQICGYGLNAVYHADNEYCTLVDMKNGFRIFESILDKLNK